jgi:flagellar protein FlaF
LDGLRLSAFVDRRIFETLAAPAPEKLEAIININNNIAAGLRGSAK